MILPAKVVLGGPSNDAFLEAIIRRIEGAGVAVAAVDLDMTVQDDAIHRARFWDVLGGAAVRPVIGGFSLGARVAATMCPDVAPRAFLGFGYPLHAAKDPGHRHGLRALRQVTVPTRIIQGARDPHGTEAEVVGYELPDFMQVSWLPDGNHRYVPRKRSGFTEEEHLVAAAGFAIAFIRSL